jgi:hypothetical protein
MLHSIASGGGLASPERPQSCDAGRTGKAALLYTTRIFRFCSKVFSFLQERYSCLRWVRRMTMRSLFWLSFGSVEIRSEALRSRWELSTQNVGRSAEARLEERALLFPSAVLEGFSCRLFSDPQKLYFSDTSFFKAHGQFYTARSAELPAPL